LWPEGIDAVNHPDLPTVADKWIILDQGNWGTLGATRVGFNRVMVGVFKGYSQMSGGIMFSRDQVVRLHALFLVGTDEISLPS
jgi:hypothetical protein